MARPQNLLTAKQVASATLKRGLVADGGNLYLNVGGPGSRSWVVRIKVQGRERDIGIGSSADVTLARAREIRDTIKALVAKGADPLSYRGEAGTTFGEVAKECLTELAKGWKNDRLKTRWEQILAEPYAKTLSGIDVGTVGVQDVLAALKPVWQTKPTTAKFWRGMIERVLSWAMAHGHRDADKANPADWRGVLRHLLAAPKRGGNWAAMPFADVPAFYQSLTAKGMTSARVLQMILLTACRKNEIAEATWNEVDFKACTLTIPASRMKGGLAHVVPLTRPALDILKAQLAKRSNSTDLIFPSDFIPTQPYEGSNINRLLAKPFTVHATARSSFRDWAGDCTEFPRDVAEMCLAHRVGNATELAYRRSTALERRGALMKAWADYLTAIDCQTVAAH
ncbi:tyrosine-type recombinase/integrase [Mesorhizobium wenxiniae]|uniref:Integrase n=1 Tax=Mesorhizobium wenxiniae TaxID=2014805 RepID=A0A271K6L1_9HYPH|nr:site-specific integrase [Mesorhizobium wenxiniae]PAP91406.1 hypothetical protein CIT31_32545 [Mesorhizobium wenxiniae]